MPKSFYLRFIKFPMGITVIPSQQWWYFFIAAAILIGVLLYIIFTEWGSMGSLIGVAALTVFQAVLFVLRYSAELTNVWSLLMFALLLAVDFVTWFAHSNEYKN